MWFFILIAICSLVLSPVLAASSEDKPVLLVSTSTQTLDPGEHFTIDMIIENGVPSRGIQFNLLFDPAIVQVDKVTEGNHYKDWAERKEGSTFLAPGTIDNEKGFIKDVALVLVGGDESGQTGKGTAVTVHMTAKEGIAGTSLLKLSNVIIIDKHGNKLTGIETESSQIDIGQPGTPIELIDESMQAPEPEDEEQDSSLPEPPPEAEFDPVRQAAALQAISQENDIPMERLHMFRETGLFDAVTGEKAWHITIEDAEGVQTYHHLVIDENGKKYGYKEYLAQREKNKYEKYGKLNPSLYELLQNREPEDMVKVWIWLNCDAGPALQAVAEKYPEAKLEGTRPSRETDQETYNQVQAEMKQARKQAYRAIQQPVIDLIQSRGYKVITISNAAPSICTEIPKSFIMELEKRDDVASIFQSLTYQYGIDTSVPSVRADIE